MCILFIHCDPQPPKRGYRLIIASNRDEYYKRPAKQAFLCPKTRIIGGRDMEPGREGGMWLGVSLKPQMIKFAALLNVTGEEKAQATSGRGPLVYNYLETEKSALEYSDGLQNDTYSAFNLLMLEVTKSGCCAYHHSNSPPETFKYPGQQTISFGNSTPETPFTKVKVGRQKFQEIIKNCKTKTQLVDELVQLLKCQDCHLPDPELERRAPWGLTFLSSIFVNYKDGGYGTRTHSIILVDENYEVEFIEFTMKEPIDPEQPQWAEISIKSQL